MKIRPATSADIPTMLALERGSTSAAHWSEEQYSELFQLDEDRPERIVLIAESSRTTLPQETTCEVTGFLVARHVAHEWELENIVVSPAARRRSVGKQLMDTLFTTARKTNSEAVFLEVRESNVAARSLYEKLGFQQTGRRPAYYSDPSEDAILYCTDLS